MLPYKLNPGSILFFLFIFFQIATRGQDSSLDELKEKLSKTKEDTSKVNLLLELYTKTNWTDVRQSLQYANDALELSKKLQYENGMAISYYSLALIFADFDFQFSEELIMNSMEYAEKSGDSNLIAKINNIIGNLKNNKAEYATALKYFDKSIQYFLNNKNDSLAAAVYNNVAISYKGLSLDSLVLVNYNKAIEINKSNRNYLWLATNYFNMGYDLMEWGDTALALNYMDESYEIARNKGFSRLLPYIYNLYAKYYQNQNKYDQATNFAQKALKSSQGQMNRLQEKNALKLLEEIHYLSGNVDSAYLIQKRILSLNDSIKKDDRKRELDLLDLKYKYQEEMMQFEMNRERLELEITRKKLTYTIFILALGVVLAVVFILFVLQQTRMRRSSLEQKAMALESEKLGKELEYKKKELTTNVMYLLKKNEFIAEISKKLQSVNSNEHSEQNYAITGIINELEKNSSMDVWSEFETRFQEIYGDFYYRVSSKFPGLTPNDLKLCAFLRLNMSSKEISAITFQSAESLKIARHRLRKKLGLSRDENLVTFLNQL